jgi:hypothetical protein
MSANWTYVQLGVWTFTPTEGHQLFTYRRISVPQSFFGPEKIHDSDGNQTSSVQPENDLILLTALWHPSGVPWRQNNCGCHQQHGWEDYCHPLAWSISERVPIHGWSAHGNPVFYT